MWSERSVGVVVEDENTNVFNGVFWTVSDQSRNVVPWSHIIHY